MRPNPRIWFLISILLFLGAIFFWLKGNEHREKQRSTSTARPTSQVPAGLPGKFKLFSALPGSSAVTNLAETGSETTPPKYTLRSSATPLSELMKSDHAILMQNAWIESGREPEIPVELRAQQKQGAYIVQARGVIGPEFRQRLQEAKAQIVAYVPNNAYLVRLPDEQADALESDPLVQTVAVYHPYYKIDQRIMEAVLRPGAPAPEFFRITLFPVESDQGSAEIKLLGGEIVDGEPSPFGPQVVTRLPSGQLAALAQLSQVQGIEPESYRAPANDLTRVQLGISPDPIVSTNHLGLTGTNVWVSINDSGIDATHPDLVNRVFSVDTTNPTNNLTDFDGHGTHVAGILGGGYRAGATNVTASGSSQGASFRGMAPAVKMLSLRLDYTPDVTARVTDTYLVETAARSNYVTLNRTNQALISNNSWTYIGASQYDSAAARYDAATRDALPDLTNSQPVLFLFAAGNSGRGLENGLGGEPNSIASPGTAKNVITVSALEHLRLITNGIVITNVVYDSSNAPVDTNYVTNMPFMGITDSDTEVASFASRGNVGIGLEGDFGRFKPDVVAPGTFIVSARSKDWRLENDVPTNSPLYALLRDANAALGDDKYRYESGTTVAVPAISGMLALMQEFFEFKAPTGVRRKLSPALMKALVINGARSANELYDLQVRNRINYQGWGLPNLQRSLPALLASEPETSWPILMLDQNVTNALATGQSKSWRIRLETNALAFPLRITLVWTDPPGNPQVATKLVNDLDLIVTNEETGLVFYGNNIPSGSDFTEPSQIGADPNPDLVNNVENIFIRDPESYGTNFVITVRARRVNVNSVTDYHALAPGLSLPQNTNDVRQDFALVISTANTLLTNAFKTFGSTTNPPPASRTIATLTNGLPLLNERVGANPSLVLPNGITNQWNFYVFTNMFITNELVAMTNGSNVAFVTFAPPNLARPRNFEADLDLFVSRDSRLTNLHPVALAGARRSVTRGGTEAVIFTNAVVSSNEVFYVAVKSEDQQAAEFGLISLSTDEPFEEIVDGRPRLRVFPPGRAVPDGSASLPQAAIGIAIGVSQTVVQRATVTNNITHENMGDLVGTLRHNNNSVVLLNHPIVGATNWTFVFDDSDAVNRYPFAIPSEGPGTLNSFVSDVATGPWIFYLVDNALTHTGRLEFMTIEIEPLLGGDLSDAEDGIDGIVRANSSTVYYLDVPEGATNLVVRLSNINPSLPLQLLARRGLVPTTNSFDKAGTLLPGPGGIIELTLGLRDNPPLQPGRYYIGVFNGNPTDVTYRITAFMEFAFAVDLLGFFEQTNSIPILDDAVTTSSIIVRPDREIADMAVGVRIDHPRVADLALTLVSPQGTRIVLSENRGGLSTNGFGSGVLGTNLAYATFTDDTNRASSVIKFASPPYNDPGATYRFVLTNSFEGETNGNYAVGSVISGWQVVSNTIGIITDPLRAHSGSNLLSLGFGAIKQTVPTVVGRDYQLKFVYRAADAPNIFSTGLDNNRGVLPFRAVDPHYTLLQSPHPTWDGPESYVIESNSSGEPFNLWLTNDTRSQWIAPYPQGPNDADGLYVYRAILDLFGYDPSSVRLRVRWAGDNNAAELRVNGRNNPSTLTNGFASLSPAFDVVGPFDPGINSLDFHVDDLGFFSGLRVQVENFSVTALPGTSTNPVKSARVRIDGAPSQTFRSGVPIWQTNVVSFLATTNQTTIAFEASSQPGIWIDSVSLLETGQKYFLPEEALTQLKSERSAGEWKLEVWDTRAGNSTGRVELISWKLDFEFDLPSPFAVALTNRVLYTGVVSTNEAHYFMMDTCPDTTIADIRLDGPAGALMMQVDRSGFPTGNPESDDYEPLFNVRNNTTPNDVATMSLTTVSPRPAPLEPGKRFFIVVRNVNQFQTNAYTLRVNLDRASCLVASSSATLSNNVPVANTAVGGSLNQYSFNVSPNASSVRFELVPQNGDVGLLLRKNAPPELGIFDYVSDYTGTVSEFLTVDRQSPIPLSGGTWYAAVKVNSSESVRYTLRAVEIGGAGGRLQVQPRLGSSGELQFSWAAVLGQRYSVQASVDLRTWVEIASFTANQDPMTFIDYTSSRQWPMRFYRVVQAP